MVKTGDSKRQLKILLMVLAVLVVGLTATGYADPLLPGEQVTGPAVVGSLSFVQTDSTIAVTFNIKCRGVDKTFAVSITGPLPITAEELQGLRFNGVGPTACPGQQDQPVPGNDLIVKAVAPGTFQILNGTPTVHAVLLFVVAP
jgi:hypothetical protein